jgi:hypothetical protein
MPTRSGKTDSAAEESEPRRPDLQPLIALVADLEREANREDLPENLRKLASIGLDRMAEFLEAARSGNRTLADEILNGTQRGDGKRHPDGLRQVLPYWARGTAVLDELVGVVTVHESVEPPTVTVLWDRVPRHRRKAAASLASELVDCYRPRPRGGRPRKSRNLSG